MVRILCPKCERWGSLNETWATSKKYRYYYVKHTNGKPTSCYLPTWMAKRLLKKLDESHFEIKGGWQLFKYKDGKTEWRFIPLNVKLRRGRPPHCVSCIYARPRGRKAQYCRIHENLFILPDTEACPYYLSTNPSRRT
jgi:hypothetical protein